MLSGHDGPAGEGRGVEESDVIRYVTGYRNPQGKDEIAKKEPHDPPHSDLMAAHETFEGCRVEVVPEELSVGVFLVRALEVPEESSDGHVRYGQQLGKSDPILFSQFTPVIRIQTDL